MKRTDDISTHEVAIVDANTLARIGLQRIIEEVMPMVTVRSFGSMEELIDDTPDAYARYLVSSGIYLAYNNFFRQRAKRTVVMVGDGTNPTVQGIATLVTTQGEQALARNLMALYRSLEQTGTDVVHAAHHTIPSLNAVHELSAREVEVLILVAQGFKNKEIAERLHISLTTVISHRKNITDKLGIKSAPGLTIYAVLNGYIDADYI